MKRFVLVTILSINLMTSCRDKKMMDVRQNSIDSISLNTGVFTAWTLRQVDTKHFNLDAFHAGMRQQLNTGDVTGKIRQADFYIGKFLDRLRKNQAQKNLKEGEEFLRKNKLRKDIFVTASGLQYEKIVEQKGTKPTIDDSVVVKITGTLIDGREFIHAKDDTLAVRQEDLKGLSESLSILTIDSRYKFYLPTSLAFSNHPPPFKNLKANVPLIFEIELLSIIPHTRKN